MKGNIGTRNTILDQFGDSWTMYWYLFTLETLWVIDLGFFWMRDVAVTVEVSTFCSQKETHTTLTYHSKQ